MSIEQNCLFSFDFIQYVFNDKYKNDLLYELPDILTVFCFHNQEYFEKFNKPKIDKNELIEFIVERIVISRISHAEIIRLCIKYLDVIFPKPEPIYIQMTIFDDGSRLW